MKKALILTAALICLSSAGVYSQSRYRSAADLRRSRAQAFTERFETNKFKAYSAQFETDRFLEKAGDLNLRAASTSAEEEDAPLRGGIGGSTADPSVQIPVGDGVWVLLGLSLLYALKRRRKVLPFFSF